MNKNHFISPIGFLLGILILFTTGCEESVDPILETDEVFSLFGFLNPRSDVQAVRVFAIDGILEPEIDQPLDAIVRSKNLSTGETHVWRDSVITFPNLSVGHVFYAPFTPEHGVPYELTAERSDGETASVEVFVPQDGITSLENIFSARSSVRVDLLWLGIPRIIQTEVIYSVRVPFPDGSDTTTVRVSIPSGRLTENSDGTWKVTILPSEDIGTIFLALAVQPGRTPVFLKDIEVKAFVVSEDWVSPIGVFDPELLVQPGTFSNVSNGFGFVGGGYFDSYIFELDDDVARNAGFSID